MMSAMDPPLHERVYEGLKEDYLAGHFVPGKRIDIQELATRYRSSKTPVREAAFIMAGERLLTHHTDGGFLVPILTPRELVELLDWHMQLLIAILATVKESAVRQALQPYAVIDFEPSAVGIAIRTKEIFSAMAEATGNRQAVLDVRRLNDRLHYNRITEITEPAHSKKELAKFTGMEVGDLRKATRRRVEVYHARKIDRQLQVIRNGGET
jgi:DNA-binding GntR family transcriptional regulator